MLEIFAQQINMPSGNSSNGMFDSVQQWLLLQGNSGWALVIALVPFALAGGFAMYAFGGFSANKSILARGKAGLGGVVVGLILMFVALAVANYVLRNHPS